MAKATKHQKVPAPQPQTPVPSSSSLPWYRTHWMALVIAVLTFAVYANSLGGGYVQDDAIVISQNQYTQQGFGGLGGIFGKDSFFGFFKEEGKAHLVEGGRYRPLSIAMFAIEHAIFGDSPFMHHLIGLLLYILTCVLGFHLLRHLLAERCSRINADIIAFLAMLVYAVHPVHTEVVANIKGRDETMAMLFGLGSMWYLYRSFSSRKGLNSVLSAVALFLSLLSKENGLVFLALAPLAIWFFTSSSAGSVFKRSAILLVPVALYMAIRMAVLGSSQATGPIMELLNNPFLEWNGSAFVPVGAAVKFGTIMVTLGKYLMLMLLPVNLSHDYYPMAIPLTGMGDMRAILPFILLLASLAMIIIRWRKKDVWIYGLIFFLVAIFPMSNIPLSVGTLMSERFLFIPSFGLCLILGWAWDKYLSKGNIKSGINILLALIILILSFLTMARNSAWHDNYTLFTTDIQHTSNSVKLLTSAGGVMTDSAWHVQDPATKQAMLDEAAGYLDQAISLHPLHKTAYLLKGNNRAFRGDYAAAIPAYEKALQIDSTYTDAKKNLAISYREVGKAAGEKEQNLQKAEANLAKALKLDPNDGEALRLYGVCLGFMGRPREALPYFERAARINPQDANLIFDLGSAYFQNGMKAKGDSLHQAAVRMNPELKKRLIQ